MQQEQSPHGTRNLLIDIEKPYCVQHVRGIPDASCLAGGQSVPTLFRLLFSPLLSPLLRAARPPILVLDPKVKVKLRRRAVSARLLPFPRLSHVLPTSQAMASVSRPPDSFHDWLCYVTKCCYIRNAAASLPYPAPLSSLFSNHAHPSQVVYLSEVGLLSSGLGS